MTESTISNKQNGQAPTHTPDPEVLLCATRRRFGAAYKRQIVAEVEAAPTGEPLAPRCGSSPPFRE